jgi:hypothetical protein
MDKSFQPSPQASYMDKIRAFEKDMLEKCQQAISKTWTVPKQNQKTHQQRRNSILEERV